MKKEKNQKAKFVHSRKLWGGGGLVGSGRGRGGEERSEETCWGERFYINVEKVFLREMSAGKSYFIFKNKKNKKAVQQRIQITQTFPPRPP